MLYSEPTRRKRGGKLTEKWWVRVNDNGRRSWRSTGTTDQAEAIRLVRKWRDGALREQHPRTMADALALWLASVRPRVAFPTYMTYRSYVASWSRSWGQNGPGAVDFAAVEDYFTGRIENGIAGSTLNRERAALRTFARWAVRRGILAQDPSEGLRPVREQHREIRALDPLEEEELLGAARAEGYEGYVTCLLYTGLRHRTVSLLTWDDVDTKRWVWRIPAEKMKTKQAHFGRPVPTQVVCLMSKQMPTPGRPLFKTPTRRGWLRVATRAGLPDVRPHDLKRTCITRWRREGVPLDVVMWMTGNRNQQIVLDCYRKVDYKEAASYIQQSERARVDSMAQRAPLDR